MLLKRRLIFSRKTLRQSLQESLNETKQNQFLTIYMFIDVKLRNP